ncbi:MAG: YfcC family protein, partial [Allomuricauda sp.]
MGQTKKRKFPTAHTVLLIIAAFVALLTWLVPAGQYDRLTYSADTDTFLKTTEDSQTTLPATQETLNELTVKIPIEKFREGAISKP